MCDKEHVVRPPPPSLIDIKGLYPISWLSQKSKTNKNTPASYPSSNSKRWSGEAERQKEEWREEKHFEEGGRRLNTSLNKAVQKGDAEERRWMKREWISQRRSPKTWIKCMCLFSQLITLYRGLGLTLYTTHTHDQVEGDEMSVPIATRFESLNESHSPFLQWPE